MTVEAATEILNSNNPPPIAPPGKNAVSYLMERHYGRSCMRNTSERVIKS